MGAAKAVAGGFAAALSDFVTYLIVTFVPGMTTLPDTQQQNVEYIVAGVLVWVAVYLTPNRIPSETQP